MATEVTSGGGRRKLMRDDEVRDLFLKAGIIVGRTEDDNKFVTMVRFIEQRILERVEEEERARVSEQERRTARRMWMIGLTTCLIPLIVGTILKLMKVL